MRSARGETAQARRRGHGRGRGADPGAEGADASPAPSTAPPTAERMGGADALPGADDDGSESEERFNRRDETLGESLRDVGDGSGIGGGARRRRRTKEAAGSMTLPSPPEAGAAPRSAPRSALRRRPRSERPKKTKNLPRRRDGETPTERARARRKSLRAASANGRLIRRRPPRVRTTVLGSATRHRGGVNVVGGHFAGFDDEEHRDKERRERAKARAPLPAPKLKGRAAEAEARRRKEEEARRATGDGFAGFGSDETNDSDSD